MDAAARPPAAHHHDPHSGRPNLVADGHVGGLLILLVLLVFGLFWTVRGLTNDIDASHTPALAIGAFALLGIALLIELGSSS